MNKNNMYYKRGMYYIDKMLKVYQNNNTFYKNRLEFFKIELPRLMNNRNLVTKDMNSFYITAMTALLGLNKEKVEKLNKHQDYKILEITETAKIILGTEDFHAIFPEFENDRKINTQYDDWLSVEQCDYPTLNYMMNIRNGILHSEIEPLDELGYMLSITNSNYTHFKSKVMLQGIISFCCFYFGNNMWSSLSEKMNIYNINYNAKITTTEEIEEVLKNSSYYQVNYTYKGTKQSQFIPEKRINKYLFSKNFDKEHVTIEKILQSAFNKKYDYNYINNKFTKNQIEIIIKMIEKYFGEDFYLLDEKTQANLLGLLTKYLIDSRGTISEWISDYIKLINLIRIVSMECELTKNTNLDYVIKEFETENNFRSVFAARTSLLIIKLYHILYRLQNKKYEEVDYNKINFDTTKRDYSYERIDIDGTVTSDFTEDITKLQTKNPSLTYNELEIIAICEIIRNSLSHGNVEMNFKIENDELVEYIEFNDEYHHKTRKLEITLEKLETFLESPAFKVEECIMKTEEEVIIKTKSR